MSDIQVGTEVLVLKHVDDILRDRVCTVVEVDGSGPGAWLSLSTCDEKGQAAGWVRRSQVCRNGAVDRLGELYPL